MFLHTTWKYLYANKINHLRYRVLGQRPVNKGNNKITELRAILQKESQNSYLYKQTKSVNNRKTVNI
jgi:hypothetical protein